MATCQKKHVVGARGRWKWIEMESISVLRRSRHAFGSIPFVWNTWPRTQVGAFTFGTMRRHRRGALTSSSFGLHSLVRTKDTWELSFNTSKTTKTRPWQAVELGSQVSKLPMFNEEIYNKVGWIAESQPCSLWDLLGPLWLAGHFWVTNFKMSLFVVTWQLVLVRRRCGSAKRISCVSELQVWKSYSRLAFLHIASKFLIICAFRGLNMSSTCQFQDCKGSTSWQF